MENTGSLWQLFHKHILVYMLGFFMLTLFQIAMNRIDWMSKTIIDLLFSSNASSVWMWVAILVSLALLAFVVRLLSRWFIFFAGRDIEYELRKRFLAQLHRLGFSFYRKMAAGDIMSRATNDVTQVRTLMGFGVMNLVNVGLAFASALQVMISISGKLTAVAFLSLPLFLGVTRLFAGKMFEKNKKNQEALGRLSGFLQNHLAGIRLIRSFSLEDAELHRFDEKNEQYLTASLSLARLRGSMGPIAGSISAFGMLLFFFYGGSLLLRGEISKGGFFAFSLALVRMTWPMIAMGIVLSILQRGRASYARLQSIFSHVPETQDGPLLPPMDVRGVLEVTNLSFSYGETEVLSNVSLSLPERGSLAILGRTGSGKTTLALLLSRLLPTPRGTVFIDGTDVCDLPISFVHQTVGYAQQEAFLFSTTVADNIGFSLKGNPEQVLTSRIVDAARDAQVLEEIETLPEQFATVVGERGVQLSGGQKQRISLARALLAAPKILVLDDPLSAVDAKTEAAILEALFRRTDQIGLILITNRIAAASRCDRIIVLEKGVIVQQGKHEDLVHQKGQYARFAEEQRMVGELEGIESGEGGVV